MKEPITAALLNIIPGMGYIYLGKRKPLGWLLFASFVAQMADMFVPNDNPFMLTPLLIISSLLIQTAIIVDAYLMAKEIARKKSISDTSNN